jgi:hypothetical protein
VPVIVVDVTEEEADKILATLDPLAAMAEMDSERIGSLLVTVQTNSEAVQELLKRTVGDRIWDLVHPTDGAEIEISPDRAEALRTKWKVESGQLWQAGPHRVVCGDCRDKDLVDRLWTAASPPLRMIWSDPPYGVSYSEKTNWVNEHRSGPSRRPIENDSLKPEQLQKLFAMALEACDAWSGHLRDCSRSVSQVFHCGSRRWRLQLSSMPRVGETELRDRTR